MSAVRDYLQEKAGAGGKEWLRREPRVTHPDILALVHEATVERELFYDDDVERYVNEAVGDLPPHASHGTDRHPLVAQLAHEVYIAKGCLKDERESRRIVAFRGEGYLPLNEIELADGDRVTVRFGTVYVGQEVPSYGQEFEARVVIEDGRVEFAPKGTRVQRYVYDSHVLVRKGWGAVERPKDRYGRTWPSGTVVCPECGQPDNCGDCDHTRLSVADARMLA